MKPSPGTEIREYRQGDLDALQATRAAAFAPVFAGFRSAVGDRIAHVALVDAERDQAQHLTSLCEPDSGAQVAVALVDGRIVGFVAWRVNGEMGEIDLNAVHPDHAGHGIGSRLYTHALEDMRSRGNRAVEVATGGDDAHAPARRAYEKVGFRAAIPSVALYLELDSHDTARR